MARIISFGHEPNGVKEKLEKPGIKDYFWSLVNSLDRFTKSQIIFVLLIIIVAPIITATSIILITRASETANINSSNAEVLVKEANTKIKSLAEGSSQTDIIAAAQQRKNLMLQLIKEDPKKFLANTLDQATIDKLPQLAKDSVEKRETVEAEATVIASQLRNEQEKTSYFLDDNKSKKRYNLNFTGPIPDITTGKQVKADVYTLDDQAVAFPDQRSIIISNPNKVLGASTTPITRTALLIRVLLSDATDQTYTDVDTLGRWFNYTYSTNAFTQETSFGLVSVTGTITPYLSIPYTKAEVCAGSQAINDTMDQKATAAGFNIANYQTLVYLFPASESCNYAAAGTVGDSPWNTTTKHRIWFVANSYSPQNIAQVYSHEFGHNIGLGHANTISCGSNTISAYANCTTRGYGDLYNTMGYGYTYYAQYSAPHKYLLGYLSPSNVINVTQTGTYTLYAPEINSTTPQVIRIPKSTGDYYFLEYRRPLGAFDNDLPSPVINGATLYVGNTNLIANSNIRETYLLDTTPGDSATVGNSGFDNASFIDGRTFSDPASYLSIQQLSHDTSKVTLAITYNAPSPTPTPTPEPPASGTWIFCANENQTCSFTGTRQVRYGTNNLYAYKTFTSSTACSNAVFGDPAYGYVKHCDYVTTTPTATPTPILPTSTPTPTLIPDNIRPSVAITYPVNMSVFPKNSNITITASASDNIGVAKVILYVNGTLKCTDTVAPYTCALRLAGKTGTFYNIQAIAYDKANNNASSSIVISSN